MSFLGKSLSFYKLNQDITRILDNMDVYILPVMNPDGYHYTWTTVRIHIVCIVKCLTSCKEGNSNWIYDLPLFYVFVSEQDVEEEPLCQQEQQLHRGRPQQKL